MAKQSFLERFIDEFAAAVVARVQGKLRGARGRPGGPAKAGDRRLGGRLCPVPGCGKPGAGPRNRWFCKDHAKSLPVAEQRRLLAAASSSALTRKAPKAAGRKGRKSKL